MPNRIFGIPVLLQLCGDIDVTVEFAGGAGKTDVCIVKFFAFGLS
jgi:hypothetical protein